MAYNYYLLVDGIQGDAALEKYPGAFTILSHTWGVTNHATAFASGGGSGKPIFQDLTITKPLSKGSPALWVHVASGNHIQHVTLIGVDPSSGLEFENRPERCSRHLLSGERHVGRHSGHYGRFFLQPGRIRGADTGRHWQAPYRRSGLESQERQRSMIVAFPA